MRPQATAWRAKKDNIGSFISTLHAIFYWAPLLTCSRHAHVDRSAGLSQHVTCSTHVVATSSGQVSEGNRCVSIKILLVDLRQLRTVECDNSSNMIYSQQ